MERDERGVEEEDLEAGFEGITPLELESSLFPCRFMAFHLPLRIVCSALSALPTPSPCQSPYSSGELACETREPQQQSSRSLFSTRPPPATVPSSIEHPESISLKRKHARSHEKRRLQRTRDRATSDGPSSHALSYSLSPGAAVEVGLNAAQLDAAKGAQTGKPGTQKKLKQLSDKQNMYELADLLAEGFEHIEWDGM